MLAWQETPAPVTWPAYGHTGRAGVGRDMTRPVDDRHLARVAGGVIRDERRQRLLGVHARGQQVEKLRAVAGVGVGLGGDRPDSGAGPGHDRADREPVRLDRDAELTGVGIARDDRVGHRIQVSLPPPLCEELTISLPFSSATRLRPPGMNAICAPENANTRRSTWRGSR